jgi:hypothetical protein
MPMIRPPPSVGADRRRSPDDFDLAVWLDVRPEHPTPRRPNVDTHPFAKIAEQLSNESTRRTAVKRLGALALGAVTIASVSRGADARRPAKNNDVDNECLNRCQRHSNTNRCHQRCRRNR